MKKEDVLGKTSKNSHIKKITKREAVSTLSGYFNYVGL
jgi:hypothetical protein